MSCDKNYYENRIMNYDYARKMFREWYNPIHFNICVKCPKCGFSWIALNEVIEENKGVLKCICGTHIGFIKENGYIYQNETKRYDAKKLRLKGK